MWTRAPIALRLDAVPASFSTIQCREGAILAQAPAGVGVQRGRIAREVRLEDVHRPVAIVVADGDAHPGLRLAVLAVGASRAHGDVGEGAVVIVAVERAGAGVVGDV